MQIFCLNIFWQDCKKGRSMLVKAWMITSGRTLKHSKKSLLWCSEFSESNRFGLMLSGATSPEVSNCLLYADMHLSMCSIVNQCNITETKIFRSIRRVCYRLLSNGCQISMPCLQASNMLTMFSFWLESYQQSDGNSYLTKLERTWF